MTSPQPESALPRGRRLGIDVGSVRIGVAVSDPDGLIATPVQTIQRQEHADEGVGVLLGLVREYDVQVVYIGLPRLLSGDEGTAAVAVRSYADALRGTDATVEICLTDERLTTVSAHQALHDAGRSSRQHRSVIDQQAAVVILQGALDSERQWGRRAGESLQQKLQSNGKLDNG